MNLSSYGAYGYLSNQFFDPAMLDPIDPSMPVIYRFQVAMAITAMLVNGVICIYSFTSETFSPHTAMIRTLLLIDVGTNVAYIMDAVHGLAYMSKSNQSNLA